LGCFLLDYDVAKYFFPEDGDDKFVWNFVSHSPEDHNSNIHRRERLKFRTAFIAHYSITFKRLCYMFVSLVSQTPGKSRPERLCFSM